MHHSEYIHLLKNILVVSRILKAMTKYAIHIYVQVFVQTEVFNSFGYIPRSTIAGLDDIWMFSFVRNCQSVLKVFVPFCIPSAMNERACCFTSLSSFGFANIMDSGHSNKYIVASHCHFNFHFHNEMKIKLDSGSKIYYRNNIIH